jgi:hypothetical protein
MPFPPPALGQLLQRTQFNKSKICVITKLIYMPKLMKEWNVKNVLKTVRTLCFYIFNIISMPPPLLKHNLFLLAIVYQTNGCCYCNLCEGDTISLWNWASNGSFVHPPDDIGIIWSSGGMILTTKNLRTRRKPVPVPLCPPQVPHGLTWARTRASAVRCRWQPAWAMARPQQVVLNY